jgi:hypothetical protein
VTEAEINGLTDTVTNAVDEWVRAGGGTYDELQFVVEKAIREVQAASSPTSAVQDGQTKSER